MGIKLFDIQNDIITPTEHCYTIESLKHIMDKYPKDYLAVYAYLFYMSCINEEENPFANIEEINKEDFILKQIGGDFSSDDPLISNALDTCKKLYDVPSYRFYRSAKIGVEKMGKWLENAPITEGRDGNGMQYNRYMKDYDSICKTFEERWKKLKEELSTTSRGGHDIAYDQ